MKRAEDDDGVQRFLLQKREEMSRMKREKCAEAQRIHEEAQRRAELHRAEMLERDRKMMEHEETVERLRQQLLQKKKEEEWFRVREEKLQAAAESLGTPASSLPAALSSVCQGTAETTTSTAAAEFENKDAFRGQDAMLGSCEDGSTAVAGAGVKSECVEYDDSPWLSSSGLDSLKAFDRWRQRQQQHVAQTVGRGQCKMGHVIVLSSDSDDGSDADDEEERELSNTGSWPQIRFSGEASCTDGLKAVATSTVAEKQEQATSAEYTMKEELASRAQYATHDTGSCSRLGNVHHRQDEIEAVGAGQGVENLVQENWPLSKTWSVRNDEQLQPVKKRVCRRKLEGRLMVNYHLKRLKVCRMLTAALEKVSRSAFCSNEEWHVAKVQKAQQTMTDWEYNYMVHHIPRHNFAEAEETIPVPAVGERLEICYKGRWCIGDVIHYCYSDGEHTVLLEGNILRVMKLREDNSRQLPAS